MCLLQCSFMEYKNFKVVFRRYASLYFIVGVDNSENELSILEFIHNIVETFDRYFESVCELDVSPLHTVVYASKISIGF
ncbi:AP-4 complex subunit sigma [Geodia barretti]|uniref:AP-4 complex subunit sigma n=1 Tax=Geodia barretti TaxID=519541 RepID=A0AA35TK41_GEOBA|nr:AP-4 complex subunit sigma [Geodia barretti]